MNALIVIPTYDEAENITRLIPAVFEALPRRDFSVLVVDDGSPDGTGDLVAKMIETHFPERLHLLRREGKGGLASAYIAGFRWGMERGFDAFLEMDADFSHKPEYLPEMFAKIAEYDVVIGSRNVPGGGVENWSLLRKLISRGGSLYARTLLHCPVADLTGGFNMWRKSALDSIDLDSIISRGYSFQVEMKYRAYRHGCRIVEFPILFPDRKAGTSKMSGAIFREALRNIWRLRALKFPEK